MNSELVVYRKKSNAVKLAALRDTCKTTRHYRTLNATFEGLCRSTLFQDITIHDPTDWLVSHQTEDQTFMDWNRSYRGVKSSKSVIYIQPLGWFTDHRAHLLTWLQKFCSAFYYGVNVQVMPVVPLEKLQCGTRINPSTQRCQLNARDIIEFLKRKRKSNSLCTIAVTMVDLYPRETWNYVFGLASLTNGVGVFSFARYSERFNDVPAETDSLRNYEDWSVSGKLLWRACKVMTHELGHMFGMQHCVYYNCAMNGSNHLQESDRRAGHLCPICLRKLHEALKFDLVERYGAMLRFCEGAVTKSAPLAEFRSLGAWLRAAIEFLEKQKQRQQIKHR